MWRECQKQRHGYEVYEDDHGFFVWGVYDFLFIAELYIMPNSRGFSHLRRYREEAIKIAKAHGLKEIKGIIRVDALNPARLVSIYNKIGFEVTGANDNKIVVTMGVE